MSNSNGPTYCEVCGKPGDHISVEEWVTCAAHFTVPKIRPKQFSWRTGEELDESGRAPSLVRQGPRSRWDYDRPFCEVCGAHPGANCSVEGWSTCDEHVRAPKPASPVFHWSTGVRLGPYEGMDDGLGPVDPFNMRYPTTFCELYGEPGLYIGADGWCTCRGHLNSERPEHPRFSWTDGFPLDEHGRRPLGAPPSLSPKNTTCEICGSIGNLIDDDGWVTCESHRHSIRPTRRLWHWRTGNRLGPYVGLDDDEQPGELVRPWA